MLKMANVATKVTKTTGGGNPTSAKNIEPIKLNRKNKNKDNDKINEKTYFLGCYQNINYFNDIRDILLKDFSLKIPLDSKNAQMKDRILNTPNAIMLHIRRGDYLNYPSLFINFGSAYYNGALKAIKKRLNVSDKLQVFVFSNDIKWCEERLLSHLDSNIIKDFEFDFVDINGEGDAAYELELMKACTHFIVPNSTFSWWAAYLNENPQKIVITPNTFLSANLAEVYENHAEKMRQKDWIKVEYAWGDELP